MNEEDRLIIVGPIEEGRLFVRLPYSPERVAAIKTIAGRRWHDQRKLWSVPAEQGTLERLRELFAGEAVELHPTLRPGPPAARAPRRLTPAAAALVDRLRAAVRARGFSPRTEEAYAGWASRFLESSGAELEGLGEADVARFLTALAEQGRVSASTQNQAFNALLFLFNEALGRKLGLVDGVVRAKAAKRLPIVLSREEVRRVLDATTIATTCGVFFRTSAGAYRSRRGVLGSGTRRPSHTGSATFGVPVARAAQRIVDMASLPANGETNSIFFGPCESIPLGVYLRHDEDNYPQSTSP